MEDSSTVRSLLVLGLGSLTTVLVDPAREVASRTHALTHHSSAHTLDTVAKVYLSGVEYE